MYPFSAHGYQALAVAGSLLEEASLMPFTFCGHAAPCRAIAVTTPVTCRRDLNAGTRQHLRSAAEVESARAPQAARAGLEWASFQVLRNPPVPAAAPACFGTASFTAPGLGACPNTTANPGNAWVERQIASTVVR